ncbi:Bulb-type lectin domain [Macleaya cordata]|uniref:Bulb-type lectin domain n=1 Tax=Macleaya cordata TaxID=56857 RepID=A0A200QXM5_MACCD|nr:Bulb-type lectin domain [Macleaya cordata]
MMMMSSPNLFSSCHFIFFFFISFCSSSSLIAKAQVPVSKTFTFVNQGDLLSGYLVEYKADYRPLNISNYPFSLCFYNTTPNSFFLALGMGNATLFTSLIRWVWTANHARPVTENAKLIFGRNGNLVLVDAGGQVAWQTRTANKGVVDIKLHPNGNLVLLDKNGGFVWQSFDHPTDTLLVGQSLYPAESSDNNKLVNGAYSVVVTRERIDLFFKSPFSSNPLRYYSLLVNTDVRNGPVKRVNFVVASGAEGPDYANQLRLETINNFVATSVWAQPKYNSTLSMLRLGSDGNIRVYTYYEKGVLNAWEETYTVFTNSWLNGECYLPEKCGSLGICKNSQCVACPTPKGLAGWSEDCKLSKLPSCNSTGAATADVNFYKIEGVEHFLNTYDSGERPVKIEECRKKCSNDCKCVAFFYRRNTESCLLASQLNTLIKNDDSEQVAFIKYAK